MRLGSHPAPNQPHGSTRRVVLTGGPGAGKTTLLTALGRLGHFVVSDSAREIIAERLARGETPRPDPTTFAREILRRDAEKYATLPAHLALAFFDRSALEAIAMLHECEPMPNDALNHAIRAYRFEPTVFVLPPWEAIYCNDSERDHAFDHAQRVYLDVVRWYRRWGYDVHELPRVSVAERVSHLLSALESQIPPTSKTEE